MIKMSPTVIKDSLLSHM